MWDADIIIKPEAIVKARDMIKDGYDLTYPYNGNFVNYDRFKFKQQFIDKKFDELLIGEELHKKYEDKGTLVSLVSYGGVNLKNKASYIKAGMENEELRSFGSEDTELFHRFRQLKMKIGRVEDSVVYHLNHFRGENSSEVNKFANFNAALCNVIGGKDKEEIEEMIAKWSWRK